MSDTRSQVAVVGTLNLDLVVRVQRRPEVGETVLGTDLSERSGGKGANQARAVAEAAGVPDAVAMVGVVGDDAAGKQMLDDQRAAGVDTTHIRTADGVSGRAIVEVDADGDNSIVVIAGANDLLTPDGVREALDEVRPAVVLTQLESPRPVTAAVAQWVTADGAARFVLNPSPAVRLDADILAAADPLVVNEGEGKFYAAQSLDAESESSSEDTPEQLIRRLARRSRSVVMTLGPRGVLVAIGDEVRAVEVEQVAAVDTTGAGDHFVGVLAARLAQGVELGDASAEAAASATRYVSRARD